MASVALNDDGLRTVKRALVSRFTHMKSSHLTEALAAGCGHRTHASFLAAIREGNAHDPDYALIEEEAFFARLEDLTGELGDERHMLFDWLPVEPGDHFLKTTSAKYHEVDYSRSVRRRAWRNALVAAINEALSRRLLSLRPGDNRWPGAAGGAHGQKESYVFEFQVGGIPAVASLRDAGYDEVSVHAALWPTDEGRRWVETANAGFHAGDLFASGWLERRKGAWLQVSDDSGKGWSFQCRRHRLAEAAAIAVRPAGYADRGTFAF